MSCGKTCSSPKPDFIDFGAFPHCTIVCIPIEGLDQDKLYHLKYYNNGIRNFLPTTTTPEGLCFDASCLNECKEIFFTIVESITGEEIGIQDEDGDVITKFKLHTVITKINNKESEDDGDTFAEIGSKPNCINNLCQK